jgi:type IV secretion system protein VirB8
MTEHSEPNIAGARDNGYPRLSRRTLEQLAKADAWDTDRMEQAGLSIRRAWLAAGAGALVGVLGIAAAAWSHRTPPPPPMAVVVDRSTGQAQVISKVTQADVPALAVLDQHNAAQYVRAREGYFPSLLQRDYDAVARMSTPVAFKAYGDRFVGEKALHKQLGMTQEHRIAIVSARPVRLPSPTSPTNATTPELLTGEMVVTFDKEVRSNHSPQPVLTRHVATIQYEYRPSAMSKDIDRIENPFGFVVTAYRVDAELGTPAPATPPAAAAQTAQTTGAKS